MVLAPFIRTVVAVLVGWSGSPARNAPLRRMLSVNSPYSRKIVARSGSDILVRLFSSP
jgi:hypothetical protein